MKPFRSPEEMLDGTAIVAGTCAVAEACPRYLGVRPRLLAHRPPSATTIPDGCSARSSADKQTEQSAQVRQANDPTLFSGPLSRLGKSGGATPPAFRRPHNILKVVRLRHGPGEAKAA